MNEKIEDLTIAIVSYNSYPTIVDCMDAFIKECPSQFVIVDNNSPDNSSEKLRNRYPGVKVITSENNIGYGRAANLAAKHTTTRYLFLVNPDLKLTKKATIDLLEGMLNTTPHPSIMAPAVRPEDHLHRGIEDRRWLIGAALLMDLDALEDIGLFDESIFLFSEETDLCYRAKKQGHRLALDTNIYIQHLLGQSSTPDPKVDELKNWHFAWSHMYFYQKHGLAEGKKNPYRVKALYFIKWITATSPEKRLKYKSRLKGTSAYLRGQKAFKENDTPYWP